jgi:hypothetical protein
MWGSGGIASFLAGSEERAPGTHWTGGWVCHRYSLDVVPAKNSVIHPVFRLVTVLIELS